jgi:hypothetical protein
VTAAAANLPGPCRTWIDRARRAADGFTLRFALGAFAVLLLPLAWNGLELASTAEPGAPNPLPLLAASAAASAVALVPALLLADVAVDDGAPRGRAYVAASALAMLAAFGLLHLAARRMAPWLAQEHSTLRLQLAYFLQADAHWIAAITAFHASRRNALRTIGRVGRMQLENAQGRRRALEHRVAALQARIDTGFLLEVMRHVGRLHARDAARAMAVLGDLIDWLRAATPRAAVRAGADADGAPVRSTVAAELALAAAYLSLRRSIAEPGALAFAVDAPPGAAAGPFAPMVVGPLLEIALGDAPAERTRGRLTLAAGRDGARLWLAVDAVTVPAQDAARPDDRLAVLRGRVGELLGEGARLVDEQAGGRRRLLLEWPDASADRRPR